MKISRELQIGIMGVVAVMLILVGLSYFQGTPLFSSQLKLEADYANVNGLNPGDKVLLSGYKIGQITAMNLNPETGNIHVVFAVEKELKIPTDSRAEIGSLDLIGTKGILIKKGKATTYFKNGDRVIPGIEASLTDRLQTELEPTKANIDVLINNLVKITKTLNSSFTDTLQLNRVMTSVEQSMRNINAATGRLDYMVHQTDSTLHGANVLTTTLAKNAPSIDKLLKNSANLTDSLNATIAGAHAAVANLNGLMADIKQGKGSAGKLLVDPKLYDNLAASTASLNALLVDFKANPKRYVHFSVFGGGKDKAPAPAVAPAEPAH